MVRNSTFSVICMAIGISLLGAVPATAAEYSAVPSPASLSLSPTVSGLTPTGNVSQNQYPSLNNTYQVVVPTYIPPVYTTTGTSNSRNSLRSGAATALMPANGNTRLAPRR